MRLVSALCLAALLVACQQATSSPTPSETPSTAAPTDQARPTHPPPTSIQDLLIIGDSLMRGADEQGGIRQLLTVDGWNVEIVAEVGKDTGWGIERVRERSSVPRVVVVELGTNPGSNLNNYPAEIDTMVNELKARGARRIAWIPPVSSDPNRYEEKDQALLAAQGNGLTVLGWPERVSTNQQWFGFDGVHMTTDGYIAFATFITDEIWRFRS